MRTFLVYNILQNALDDGILMGCDENDFKKIKEALLMIYQLNRK